MPGTVTAPTFTKRPISIQAIQWTGSNLNQIWDAFGAAHIYGPTPEKNPDSLLIGTLEGDMRANLGDWIIRGVKDELYPCKDDIFRASYEPDNGAWCNYCHKVMDLDTADALIDDVEGGWIHAACDAKANAAP